MAEPARRPARRPDRRAADASSTARQSQQQAAHESLDRVIHERVRLAIVSALAVTPALSFNDLKKLLRITDGNLSVHARRLEEAGYLECLKSFEGRVPRTEYRLTTAGKRALQGYLDHMEALIRATRAR
ncbi:MAG: transcriptional regulator [Candidatus Eisenbacteria bacterium]|uniref:Transcriptional regulator n=1 Tax=Eiseniibacteriota bacterium TaxID=2212470 RepID=A0A933SG03_UNCEI|nr:transcriptional regulator [Candidatus Eisenbacteria bacterium]